MNEFIKRWTHKLFHCCTFWSLVRRFRCPGCNKRYRCYYDGNDIPGVGRNYCNKCSNRLRGGS